MTGQIPFFHLKSEFKVVLAVVNQDEKPRRPEDVHIPDELWKLWEECWSSDPAKRPEMRQVVNSIIYLFPK